MRNRREQIDRRNICRLELPTTCCGEIKGTDKIDFSRMVGEMITNPACPLKEIRIITGKAKQAEFILDKNLPCQVNERRETFWVRTVIFLRCDKSIRDADGSMELDDAR